MHVPSLPGSQGTSSLVLRFKFTSNCYTRARARAHTHTHTLVAWKPHNCIYQFFKSENVVLCYVLMNVKFKWMFLSSSRSTCGWSWSVGRQKSSCLAPVIQQGTLHRQYLTIGQKVQIPGLIFCTVALNETCTFHALCICHIIVVEVIINSVLDDSVCVCDAGIFNDFVCGLHYIMLVDNMICEEWFGKGLERGSDGLKQGIVG